MVKLSYKVVLFLSFLIFSCGKQYVFIIWEDAYNEDKIDVKDARVEISEVIDKKEIDTNDRIEHSDIKMEDNFEAFVPDGCMMPVMDCGPNCRQVTCMGSFIDYNGFDLYSHYLAYVTHTFHWDAIFLVDLDTGEERMLYITYDRRLGELVMYGNRIVFEESDHWPDRSPLWVYNLDTSTIEEVRYGRPGNLDIFPEYTDYHTEYDLYEDKLVFATGREEWNGGYEVFMFDFTLQRMIQISNTRWHYGANIPRIWDDIIVYTMIGSPFVIMVYYIQTGMTVRLTQEVPADQWYADIWENRVVWTDHRNGEGGYYGTGNSDIYWCDLPNCVPRPATTNFACQDWPSVEGDWIAWVDFRNDIMPLGSEIAHEGNIEIWAYNVSMDMEIQVASFNKNLFFPRVHNGKVYFLGNPAEGKTAPPEAIFEVTLPTF